MTLIEQLIKELQEIDQLRVELRSVESERNELLRKKQELYSEVDGLKETISDQEMKIIELELNQNSHSINLGLDTIHFRLEKGNLRVQQQLESFLDSIATQNSIITPSPIF